MPEQLPLVRAPVQLAQSEEDLPHLLDDVPSPAWVEPELELLPFPTAEIHDRTIITDEPDGSRTITYEVYSAGGELIYTHTHRQPCNVHPYPCSWFHVPMGERILQDLDRLFADSEAPAQ